MAKTAVPTSIRLDPKLRDKLKTLAKQKRWSLTTLIIAVLEAWLAAEEKRGK